MREELAGSAPEFPLPGAIGEGFRACPFVAFSFPNARAPLVAQDHPFAVQPAHCNATPSRHPSVSSAPHVSASSQDRRRLPSIRSFSSSIFLRSTAFRSQDPLHAFLFLPGLPCTHLTRSGMVFSAAKARWRCVPDAQRLCERWRRDAREGREGEGEPPSSSTGDVPERGRMEGGDWGIKGRSPCCPMRNLFGNRRRGTDIGQGFSMKIASMFVWCRGSRPGFPRHQYLSLPFAVRFDRPSRSPASVRKGGMDRGQIGSFPSIPTGQKEDTPFGFSRSPPFVPFPWAQSIRPAVLQTYRARARHVRAGPCLDIRPWLRPCRSTRSCC